MIVTDASVALKWLVDDEGSAAARDLLLHEDAIAPELIVAEICNAAWRLARAGLLTAEQYGVIPRRIDEFFIRLVPILPLAPRAAAIARELDHPAYDCFYVALAEASSAKLITADKRLVSRVSGSPWEKVILPLVP
jgi:predicted nucleic acid-binding protein